MTQTYVAIFEGDPDPRFRPSPVLFESETPQTAQLYVEAELAAAQQCKKVTLYAALSTHVKTTTITRTPNNRHVLGTQAQGENE